MNLSHPIAAVSPSLTGYVLEVLAGTTRPLTGRQITRLLRKEPGSHRGVQLVLDALAEQGVVRRLEAGTTILNALNPDHILTPLIRELAEVKWRIIPAIGDIVREEAPKAQRVILFGSVARGEADEHSDVDLLIVWPDDVEDPVRSECSAVISRRVKALLGNQCNVLHYSVDEYSSLETDAPALAENLEKDGIDLLAEG